MSASFPPSSQSPAVPVPTDVSASSVSSGSSAPAAPSSASRPSTSRRPRDGRGSLASGWRGAAVSAVTCCALAACSSPEPRLPSWPEPDTHAGAGLPVGAEYKAPTSLPRTNAAPERPIPSIAPDSRPAEERVPQIHQRGRIVVGVAQSLNRLGFRDPVTGELAGFEVDLGRELARDIFGDPRRVEFRFVDSRQRESALANGDVDVILRTMSITASRQKRVELSIPYLKVTPRLLVRGDETDPQATPAHEDPNGAGSGSVDSDRVIRNFDDLWDKTVCVTKDSISSLGLKDIHVGRLILTRTWTDCLMAMQRFQTDAIFTDDSILSGLQAQDPTTTLVGEGGKNYYYGVAMPLPSDNPDSEGLTMQINATLERVRSDGTWQRLYDLWMRQYVGAPSELPLSYRTPEQAEELAAIRRQAEAAEENAAEARATETKTAESKKADAKTADAKAAEPTAKKENQR